MGHRNRTASNTQVTPPHVILPFHIDSMLQIQDIRAVVDPLRCAPTRKPPQYPKGRPQQRTKFGLWRSLSSPGPRVKTGVYSAQGNCSISRFVCILEPQIN